MYKSIFANRIEYFSSAIASQYEICTSFSQTISACIFSFSNSMFFFSISSSSSAVDLTFVGLPLFLLGSPSVSNVALSPSNFIS